MVSEAPRRAALRRAAPWAAGLRSGRSIGLMSEVSACRVADVSQDVVNEQLTDGESALTSIVQCKQRGAEE